ncbi:MAG: hypothetical protein KBC34_00950 [Phenylobacterium sp.]|nr:hypothetical protein [Phenylobacterium sp.]
MSIDFIARAIAQKALTEAGGPGASAYQVAVANGFVGTEADWLASLKGEDGDSTPGASAYQLAVAAGFVGTPAQWLASLKGQDGNSTPGASAYQIAVANGFVGTEAAWLASLKGADGADGDPDGMAALQAQLQAALGRIDLLESPDALPPLAIVPATVPEHVLPGTPIGDLVGLHPFEVLTQMSDAGGRVILNEDQAIAGLVGYDYAAAQQHVITVHRQLAKPGRPVIDEQVDLTVEVLPELRALALPDCEFAGDLAEGAELLNLGPPLPGETRAVIPADGRIVVSAGRDKLLRGAAAWAAGADQLTIVQGHPTATNSPRETPWNIVVLAAGDGGVLVTAPSLSGIFTQGSTVTITDAVWDQPPASIDTRWLVADSPDQVGAPIVGQTAENLTFAADVVDKYVRAGQIAHLVAGGVSDEAFTDWVGPIAAPLSISGAPAAEVARGDAYTFTPTIEGGHGPYIVTNIGTPLPAGWSLNAATGAVSTEDAQTDPSNVILQATDVDGLVAAAAPFGIARQLPPKRYNFAWLNTATGDASWNNGGIGLGTDVFPNDDANVTSLLLPNADGYPQDTADAELQFGRTQGAAALGTNNTAVRAGGDVLLAGYHIASSNQFWTFRVPGPGEYDAWFAAGAGATTGTEEVMLFDGLHADLTAAGLTGKPKTWKTAVAVAINNIFVSLIDLSVWKAGNAGTSGAVAPSGAGPTFADNGITWNRLPLNALEVFRGTTTAASHVIDQNNVSVHPSTWRPQTPRTFSVTGAHGSGFTIYVDQTSRPRCFSFRAKGAVLGDVALINAFGDNLGQAPTFYANEPAGRRSYKIAPTGGKNSVSAYSLGGDLAPYFSLNYSEGYVWLTASGVRMPDLQAGQRSLEIIQTDANSSGSPHKTTLDCTVVSSQGRPTDVSYLGQITTENWLTRKYTLDRTNTAWQGYDGVAPFVSDALVTTVAEMDAALDAIPPEPDGTSWYRIRVGASFAGRRTATYARNFGSGGLLIEPAAGQDPEFDMAFSNIMVHGLHVRGLKMPMNAQNTGLMYFWRGGDPGPTGINGSGKFPKVVFENNRGGIHFQPGNLESEWAAKHMAFIYMTIGESAVMKNNRFDGTNAVWLLYGFYKQHYEGNMYSRLAADAFGPGQSDGMGSTINVFPDNNVHINVQNDGVQRELDYLGYASGQHLDMWQIRTWNQNLTNWFPNAKPDDRDLADDRYRYWAVGDRCLNNETPTAAVYEVVAVAKPDALTGGGTGPEGHGQAIVDGDVTWKWVMDYVWDNDIYLVVENCDINSASPIAGVAARQAFINSNGNHRSKTHLVFNNNAYGSYSSYGIGQTEGDTFAEFNTFVGPSEIHPSKTANGSYIWNRTEGRITALHNVVQLPTSTEGAAKKQVYDEVIVQWNAAAPVGRRPIDVLAGAFVQDATSRWTYPSLSLAGGYTRAAFKADMRAILVAKPGVTAGIRPPA